MLSRTNYRFWQSLCAAIEEANALRAIRLHIEHLALGLLHDRELAARAFPNPEALAAVRSRLRVAACSRFSATIRRNFRSPGDLTAR